MTDAPDPQILATSLSGPDRDRLLGQVYGELRILARKILAGDRARQHLAPSDLVNAAAIRIIGQRRISTPVRRINQTGPRFRPAGKPSSYRRDTAARFSSKTRKLTLIRAGSAPDAHRRGYNSLRYSSSASFSASDNPSNPTTCPPLDRPKAVVSTSAGIDHGS